MTKYTQRLPAGEDGVMQRLQDLEREVKELRAGRRLEASTIGKGGITVKGGAIILQDETGNEIGRMGAREDIPHAPDGSTQPGFILRRNDGSIAFTLDDPNPNDGTYRQLLKMQDAQGSIIFAEDTISGWGIAAPTHSLPMWPSFDTSIWPGVTTTTFAGVWINYIPLWNPILEVGISSYAETATTGGRVRLMINGTQFGSDIVIPANTIVDQNFSVSVPGLGPLYKPGQTVQIVIEARGLVASGKVKVCPSWIYGSGSYGVV